MKDGTNIAPKETPEAYAQRRAEETGIPYIVTMQGHAWPDLAGNRETAERTCGGVAGTFKRARKARR